MINDIYNAVQAILNKNDFGIITPDDFNVLAKNAQSKIVGELTNALRRVKNRKRNTGTHDSVAQVEDALNIFMTKEIIQREVLSASPNVFSDYFVLPPNLVFIKGVALSDYTEITKVDSEYINSVLKNKFITSSFLSAPVYEKLENRLFIYPNTIGVNAETNELNNDVTIRYRRAPMDPKWTFITIGNKSVFNSLDGTYQDIELPESFFNEMVVEVLLQVGISLREEQVERYAQQEQQETLQKQNLN